MSVTGTLPFLNRRAGPVARLSLSRRYPWTARPAGLPALLLLAFALRLAAAVQPGFAHPDAIYQYLEPAAHLLSGHGTVTWEWRVGMRGWLLPWFFAVPMRLAGVFPPYWASPTVLPRIVAALASLGVVWAAWTIGARASRTHAALAAFTAATWFEIIYFGAQTLSEPLATTALLAAAAMLDAEHPHRRSLAAAGLLIGLACIARPQYAPAAFCLLIVPRSTALRAAERCNAVGRLLRPVALGGGAALLIGAVADIVAGATPLIWIGEYFRQNVMLGKAAAFGTAPWYAYLAWWCFAARWATVPILFGIVAGRKRCPRLFWAALINLAVHSLIAHKEYRFVLFSSTAIVVTAALGWAELLQGARHPRRALAIAMAAVSALSLSLGLTGAGAAWSAQGRGGVLLFRALARDPGACGVALVDVDWFDYPGQGAIGGDRGITLFTAADPAARGDVARGVTRWRDRFDRIIAPATRGAMLPAGYWRDRCEMVDGKSTCLWVRANGCNRAASPFDLNAVLARSGY